MNNPNKILGFRNHLIGDIFISLPSFEVLRQLYPSAKLYVNVHKDYADITPLLLNNSNWDGVFISYGKDNVDQRDNENIKKMGFDVAFNPRHSRQSIQYGILKNNITIKGYWEGSWFEFFPQILDNSYIYDLPLCNNKITLNKWFETHRFKKTIAFHATPGNYNPSNKKQFTKEKNQELVNSLIKMGYSILQIGSPNDYKLDNVTKLNTNYFDSIKNCLSCDFFIGFDSSPTWVLSGYDFPVIAMYGSEYYIRNDKNYISSIQAPNKNAIYLDSPNILDIPNDLILEKVKEMV